MKKVFSKYVFLISVSMIFLRIEIYSQMPPHPLLLERINRGEQAAPYTLSNFNLLRSQGVDEAWTSPDLTMRKSSGEKIFSTTFGPEIKSSGNWKALVILVQFKDKPSQGIWNLF